MKKSPKPRLFTRLTKKLFCSFLYKVEVINSEALDKSDSYLLTPNHFSPLDPIFVYPEKYDKDISVIAKKELFKHVLFRWLAKKYSVFSIDRENVDIKSMLKSLEVFKKNEHAKLLLFPEGKVVKEAEEGKVYKKGAAFIAYHLEKPIIPVYISRANKLFSKVTITFGEPFFISKETFKGKEKFDEASKLLIQKIYELKK